MSIHRLLFIIILFLFSCEKQDVFSIIDQGYLPKIEITIDDYHLWSPDSGLYVIGINGAEMCGPIANYNQNWEFPASIKYIENNSTLFDEKIGLKIKGYCSRIKPMKSFGLYFRGEYGNPILNYPVFKNLNVSSYKRLFLRNAGSDFGYTHIKDISVVSIVKDYANFEYQEYNQCVVYLNNEYWGIYNLREMITPHYFQYHFGIPKDNIDLLEGSELTPIADDGSIDDYINNVVSFIQTHDLSNDNHYEHIANTIDVNSYIDYIIVNTYIGNWDWPHRNIKWWRDRTNDNSKWRWILFDTDAGFNLKRVENVWIGDLFGDASAFHNDDGSFYLFNHLIKNRGFKQLFLNQYLYYIEHVFSQDRVRSLIKMNMATISPEYDNFRMKWNVLSKSDWENEIDNMITFNQQRVYIMEKIINQLIDENN